MAENGYVCEIFFVTKSIVPKSRIYLRVRQLTSIMKLLFIAPRYNIHLFYLYGSIKLQKLLSLHPFKSKKIINIYMNRNFPIESDIVQKLEKFDSIICNDLKSLAFYRENLEKVFFLPNFRKDIAPIEFVSEKRCFVIFSRCVRDKNIELAIQIAEENELYPLIISGEHTDKEYFKEIKETVGENRNIRFESKSFPTGEQNEILLLTSNREGESNVLVDFLLKGLICIVTNDSDPNGLVCNAVNGVNINQSTDIKRDLTSCFSKNVEVRIKCLEDCFSALKLHTEFPENLKFLSET